MNKKQMLAYNGQQLFQVMDLMRLIHDASIDMKVKPYEVLFSVSWVMKKLSLTRYYAKKLIDQMTEIGMVYRMGNQYRWAVENHFSYALYNLSEGY